jgi:hypothetical protein
MKSNKKKQLIPVFSLFPQIKVVDALQPRKAFINNIQVHLVGERLLVGEYEQPGRVAPS